MKTRKVFYKTLKKVALGCEGAEWFKKNFEDGTDVEEVRKVLEKKKDRNWQICLFDIYKLSGICRTYYPDGQLGVESTYKNGKLHGKCKRYYSNGQLEEESTYKDGKLIN